MNKAPITTQAPSLSVKNGERSDSSRNGLLCALVVAVSLLITNPIANVPFLDDFSYAKTALDFARTGHFLYNGWATAMLGWLIPWGALFIKFFGFSFNVMRLSMLPIDMASVYFFHQILRRFGVNQQNAILGALTMALSPLFLPLAASYMTDIPGLFVILLCIYMCQRAVSARSNKTTLLWLCSAIVINVGGGTVRQIAWLGALVMVPSTAWFLRERRGIKIAGVLLWIFSFASILAWLSWFKKQPYSVPEHIIVDSIHLKTLLHLSAQLLKTFLCLLLITFPVSAAWLSVACRLTDKAKLRLAGLMAILVSFAIVLCKRGILNHWVIPWLTPLMAGQSSLIPGMFGVTASLSTLWISVAISLLVIAPVFILTEQIKMQKRNEPDSWSSIPSSWNELVWLLGPFSLSYLLLLTPRGSFFIIQDRYVLGLFPIAIIILLKLYQERVGTKLSQINLVALAIFAIYSIAGTHNLFAQSRAVLGAIQMIQNSGVPRSFIQAGLASDGWAQVENGSYINDPRIEVPAGAYHPDLYELQIPAQCRYEFASIMPVITPKYFVVDHPMSCFDPTKYPPVHYRTWLPPFHRAIYIQQLKK